jgi:nicotinate-nucleotide adenylyltransferase
VSKERIGVFGGTFDPPHVGHLILAMEASYQLNLKKILWVLTPDPPHKRGKKIIPVDARIKMVQAAIEDNLCFTFSYVDIDRPGPHYVLDMMDLLRNKLPDNDLVFLMGGDSLHDLPKWHKPKDFIDACDKIGVMRRPGEKIDFCDLEDALPGISRKVEFVDAPLLEISSNQIRRLIASKKPYRYYLPFEVYKIIEEMHLYKDEFEDL